MARRSGKDRGIVEKPAGSGKWWVRFFDQGRERWRRCDSKSQARLLYGRIKAEQREGKLFHKPKVVKALLLEEYVRTWLGNQVVRGKKRSTTKTYIGRLRKHVLPVFGGLPLSAIDRPKIKTWAATLLRRGLSFETAKNTVLTLSAVLTEAVEDGLITHNPALRSGKLLKRPSRLEDQDLAIFTPEEEQTLLEMAFSLGPRVYPLALTLFRTGIRSGEFLGLHREDVDFQNRCISVRRNWSHGELGTPKNGKGRRVDMSQGLAKALKEWIEVQDLEAAMSGQLPPEILFPGNLGGTRRAPHYMAENFLRYKLWFPLLKKAGVRRLGIHSTRHTFASRLIAQGENLKYIQEQLGHASISITVDTYGHLIPGGNQQAVDRLDLAATGTKTGTTERGKP